MLHLIELIEALSAGSGLDEHSCEFVGRLQRCKGHDWVPGALAEWPDRPRSIRWQRAADQS